MGSLLQIVMVSELLQALTVWYSRAPRKPRTELELLRVLFKFPFLH